MKKEYEILFTPAKIGSCELKNRFVMAPMGTNTVIEWTAKPVGYTPTAKDLLVSRAKDGVGLIVTGAFTPISFTRGEKIGDHPEAFEGLQELTDEIHSYGTKIFFQIAAGVGRSFTLSKKVYEQKDILKSKAGMDLDYINASADAGIPNRWLPECKSRALTVEEIHEIIDAIAEAAYLSKQHGVDGIDVHAVHEGYLMDQFATKHTNHRTDEYGGSLENRLRFACEVVKAIKAKCGADYPVTLRYSVNTRVRDFGKGIIPADKTSRDIGRDMEESKKAIQILEKAGYDGFSTDNGTYDSWYYAHPPVYMPLNCNLEESIEIKPYTTKPIINAGRLQLDAAANAISNGQLDFIGIARQFLADECYITKIKEGHDEDVRPCIACHLGCMAFGLWKNLGFVEGNGGCCALNPKTNNEQKYVFAPTDNPKKIAVIGAGIAGMEFALRATQKGHEVTIYEKSNRLGGVFNEAAYFSFKEKDRDLLQYYATQIKKANITVKFNSEIKNLSDLDADEIVVATGNSAPRMLQLPGSEKAINALEFLEKEMPCEDNVVIIGGGLTGCEIAYELALLGKHPTIIEVQDDILKVPGVCMANTSYLRDAFEFYKVPVHTSANVQEIVENGVKVELENGDSVTIPCDTVVMSVGYLGGTPFNTEAENVHVIGDANKVGNLMTGVWDANELALKL